MCGGGGVRKGNTQVKSKKGVSFYLFSMVVVYYTLASGILGWINPIVLQRWNVLANYTGEIHKKNTMSTRHIELDFHSFDSTCTNIY